MLEIWRTAIYKGKTYEGFEVSNLGRIKSLNYNRTGKSELLKPFENEKGYLIVGLSKNRKVKNCRVHRLVAETFLENPENKPCVNHKIEGDEGKKINMVIFNKDGSVNEEKSTIEWATYKENNNYATRNERISKTKKGIPNIKLSKTVLQLSLDGKLIREWPSIMECERNGFNRSHVCLCCNGKKPHYKGFKWCYK